MLKHCFEGSGASWERSGSADSAVAGGGYDTGGGAVQHLHLDPLEKSQKVRRVYYYKGLKVNISQLNNKAFLTSSDINITDALCKTNLTSTDLTFINKSKNLQHHDGSYL